MKLSFRFLMVPLFLALVFAVPAPMAWGKAQSFWGFVGVNGGYGGLSADTIGEDDKNGFEFNIKGLGSLYTENWVYDLGIGWLHSRFESTDSIDPQFTVISRAGFIEFSPRYRVGPRWQLGAVGQFLFGTDVTLSQNVGTNSTAFRAGARMDYEIPAGTSRVRIGAQALTDLDVSDRQVFWVQLDLQLGFRFWGDPSPDPSREIRPEEPVRESPVQIVSESSVLLSLDEREIAILFDTNKSKLKKGFKTFLGDLAAYLNKNTGEWEDLAIEGHADQRGPNDFNIRLSLDRARSVQNELIAQKVGVHRMQVRGFGSSRPAVNEMNPTAWRANRRVEIQFFGVRAPETFSKEIADLWYKHFPEAK